MTDFATPAPAPSAPSSAPPAAQPSAPPAAPPAVVEGSTAPEGFVPKEVFDREVADRIRERNLYKPYQQAFQPLDPAEREAILGLADMVRNGDTDAIVNWSITTAENVAGKSAAEIIAARQAATPVGQAVGQAPPAAPGAPTPTDAAGVPLTPEAIAAAVRQALQAEKTTEQQRAAQQQLIAEYSQQMTAAGIDPRSEDGREVIGLCKGLGGDMTRALRVFQIERSQALAAQAAVGQVAGQVPVPAPAGAPSQQAPAENLTPRQRVIARLAAGPA